MTHWIPLHKRAFTSLHSHGFEFFAFSMALVFHKKSINTDILVILFWLKKAIDTFLFYKNLVKIGHMI